MQKIYLVWTCVDHVGIDCWTNQYESFVDKIFTSKAKAMEYMLKETEGKEPIVDGDQITYTDDNEWEGEKSYLRVEEFEVEEEA